MSRALAKLQNTCSDDSDNEEESSVSKPVEATVEPTEEVVQEKVAEPSETKTEVAVTAATPERGNTTVDDSLFIKNNMAQVQLDLDAMKQDVIKEESEHEETVSV